MKNWLKSRKTNDESLLKENEELKNLNTALTRQMEYMKSELRSEFEAFIKDNAIQPL